MTSTPRTQLPDTVFRVLSSLIYIMAGMHHVRAPGPVAQRLSETSIGAMTVALLPAEPLVLLTGVVMVVAGILLALGLFTRAAALVLAACLIPITITVQLEPGAMGPLFKNIGLFGSLIFFITHGAIGYSVDGVRAAKSP